MHLPNMTGMPDISLLDKISNHQKTVQQSSSTNVCMIHCRYEDSTFHVLEGKATAETIQTWNGGSETII